MDVYEPRRRRNSRARERHMARQSRRSMVNPSSESSWRERVSSIPLPANSRDVMERASLGVQDGLWYLTHSPQILFGLIGIALVVFLLFAGAHVVNGKIFPNVWAAGVHLGDLTVEEAEAALKKAWKDRVRIQLIDGSRIWSAAPSEVGLEIDARKTAENARAIGLSGIPFGYNIRPVVSLDFTTAQDHLLDMATTTDVAPHNATFQWEGDQLVGVAGTDGRMLNVPRMMEVLMDDPVTVAQTGILQLEMDILPPDVKDPEPILEQARTVAGQPFTLVGYDPFTNTSISWSTTREVFTSWLEAGQDGLSLREDTFAVFMDAQNQSLNASGGPVRYLDPKETKSRLRNAIQNPSGTVNLRIRYRPATYEVERGDTGYRIARKTGLPFFLIEEANPGRDLGKLSPGDIINLPSKDNVLPMEPVSQKRIVVNLNNQTLMAFENGQLKFNWLISSGLESAPTSPGIYQILTHDEKAFGSSYTLCGASGCGQWEMYWFMGIYEVTPGLMNGFHGAVLLPNGAYLGGGNVGSPYTFGCIMSQNDNAKLLYDWAEQGTVVEIISSEYAPISDLAQYALSQPNLMS